MTTSMYCLYVGFDYTYIDVNALAQGIKCMYVCMYVCICMYVCMYACMHACMCVCVCVCVCHWKEGRFYLTTHSTHFIYSYLVSDIW